MATRGTTTAWTGWVIFAALMMIIVGVINILQGLVGLFTPTRTVVVAGQLYVLNIFGWALIVLIFGAVLVCVGLGAWTGRSWARYSAIVVVALHAITQIGWIAAYPVWSLLMLALDVVVLYALTVRWPVRGRSRAEEYAPPEARAGFRDREAWDRAHFPTA